MVIATIEKGVDVICILSHEAVLTIRIARPLVPTFSSTDRPIMAGLKQSGAHSPRRPNRDMASSRVTPTPEKTQIGSQRFARPQLHLQAGSVLRLRIALNEI